MSVPVTVAGVGTLVVALALGVACGPRHASAQELEHVFVEVLDQAGRTVSDLTAADFALRENNVDLDIVSVRRGTSRPMSIAVLVDNGGCIAATAELDALRDGLAAFLRTLPLRHEVSVYTIRGRVRRVVSSTTDRSPLTMRLAACASAPAPGWGCSIACARHQSAATRTTSRFR